MKIEWAEFVVSEFQGKINRLSRGVHMRIGLAILVFIAATIFSCQQLVQFYEAGTAAQAGHVINIAGMSISLMGLSYACIVIFEALFYPIARIRYREGHWVSGTIALLMLVVAIGATFTADFEANVTGRADRVAERSAVVDVRAATKAEIAALNAQRNAWKARLETAGTTQLRELNQRIDEANARIEKLQQRIEAAPVVAGGAVASDFLAEHSGQPASFWAMILLSFRLLFPACMRAFAWEFALSTVDLIKPKPKEEIFKGTLIEATALSSIPVQPAKATAQIEPPAQNEPKKATKALGGTKKNVLPFHLGSDASPKGLTSHDAVTAYVADHLSSGRHYFSDIFKKVEHVAAANYLPKPHEPIIGGMVAAHLGVKGRRDGSRGNATFYTKRSTHRAQAMA